MSQGATAEPHTSSASATRARDDEDRRSVVESRPEIAERHVNALRARLAKPVLDLGDARDGMLDCFISTYFEGLRHGLKGIVGVDAGPEDVVKVAKSVFKRRLAELGASYDQPTAEALEQLKRRMDEELRFSELPAEIAATHDQICHLLLHRARRQGGASAAAGGWTVRAPAPGVSKAPSDDAARPLPAPVTLVREYAQRERVQRVPVEPGWRVGETVRVALAQALREMAEAAELGHPVEDIRVRLRAAGQLLEAVRAFEPGGR